MNMIIWDIHGRQIYGDIKYVGGGEWLLNVYTDSVGGNGKISKIDSGDVGTLWM